jgi:hypothetical protein
MAEALSKITLGDSHVRASERSSIGMLGRVLPSSTQYCRDRLDGSFGPLKYLSLAVEWG